MKFTIPEDLSRIRLCTKPGQDTGVRGIQNNTSLNTLSLQKLLVFV